MGCKSTSNDKPHDEDKEMGTSRREIASKGDGSVASESTAPTGPQTDGKRGAEASSDSSEQGLRRPFEVDPNEPCDQCEQRFCTKLNNRDYIDECFRGKAGNVCRKLVMCAHETKCGAKKSADCYCGPDATISECMSKGGNGPCKTEIETAAETTDPSIIATRYVDRDYPVGRAMAVIDCKRRFCPKCNQ